MPTFGYTTIGLTGSNLGGHTVRISRTYSAPENGAVNSISVYDSSATAQGFCRGVIYRNSDLALIDVGTEANPNGSGWLVYDMDDQSIVSGTSYSFGIWIDASTFVATRYDANAGFSLDRDDLTYHATNPPNDPFVVDATLTTRQYSIYATYTASGGGAPPTSAPKHTLLMMGV